VWLIDVWLSRLQQADGEVDSAINNVSHEARLLKKMYLKLKD
jgi:hypothetical protein